MIWLVVAGVVVAAVVVWLVLSFNRLVRQRNLVADGWAGIDVQLSRRAQLVPNLVEVVKGYRDFERTALDSVVGARARTVEANGPAAQGEAETELSGSLKTVFAVAEGYPELKADKSFLDLQNELSVLEEDIAFSRRYYNAQVRKFNTAQQTFPSLLVAKLLAFREAEYFQADADEREAPVARM